MKYLFLFILLYLSPLHKVTASSVDSLLVQNYKKGDETVSRIIDSNNIKDSLTNKSFCSLLFENLWTITIQTDNSFVLYYGYRIGDNEVTRKEISSDNKILLRLFSFEQDKIEHPVYKRENYYTPMYWYFVLLDSLHNKKFEWNAYSKSNDKYADECFDVLMDYFVFIMNLTIEDKLDRDLSRISEDVLTDH